MKILFLNKLLITLHEAKYLRNHTNELAFFVNETKTFFFFIMHAHLHKYQIIIDFFL